MNDIILSTQNGEPVASSRDVAKRFGKEHNHVLRDIKALEEGVSKNGHPARRVFNFAYEAFTLFGGTSQTLLLSITLPCCSPYPGVHALRFGLFRFRSPLLTESMFLSLPLPT